MLTLDYCNCTRDLDGLNRDFYHTFYAEESLYILEDLVSYAEDIKYTTKNISLIKRLIFNIMKAVSKSIAPKDDILDLLDRDKIDLELKRRVFPSVQNYLS